MIKIIDNKKIDITEHEWRMYEDICKSYTTSTFKGSDLFSDLFEVDDSGIIVFLKPPRNKRTTLEAWLFLAAIYQHQHMRNLYFHVDEVLSKMTNAYNSMRKEFDEWKNKES